MDTYWRIVSIKSVTFLFHPKNNPSSSSHLNQVTLHVFLKALFIESICTETRSELFWNRCWSHPIRFLTCFCSWINLKWVATKTQMQCNHNKHFPDIVHGHCTLCGVMLQWANVCNEFAFFPIKKKKTSLFLHWKLCILVSCHKSYP